MNIIVTGSCGFIGSHLCRRLFALNHNVIQIDRKIGIDAKDIEQYIDNVDVVYHLAAQTSVFNEDKESIIKDNIDTFLTVCDVCNRHKVKLVYASSSCAERNNMTSLYGLSKQFNEQYAMLYNHNATGVRLHNVFGHNARKGTLFYNLLNATNTTIYNAGNNKRHFTYISNAVEGLIRASYKDNCLVNVVNPEYISVNQFISYMQKYIHTSQITYTDEVKTFDKSYQVVDNGIMTIDLPYISVDESMRLMFE